QINSARHLLGLTSQKDLYLFGTPISQSPSPFVHNGWFKALGFPHQYHLCETDQIEVMRKVVESPTFGGANCTIPTKEIGIELVEELSDSAKAIGAINTIYWGDSKDGQKRILKGDNTDWLALFNKISEKLQGYKPDSHRSALVLGAGGTARASLYSLHKAGFETIYLYNRTYSKGVKLAQHFEKYFKVLLVDEGVNIVDFFGNSSSQVKSPQVIVDTLPGTAQVLTTDVENSLFKNSNIESKSKNITVRFAYAKYPSGQPAQETSLISDIAPENTDSNQAEEINGLDLLREQAKYGFQLWTGVFPEY
ncbi:Aminoacid dehydrogenase-like protein, partial [Conidiobolus coronatus NRRL 28638]